MYFITKGEELCDKDTGYHSDIRPLFCRGVDTQNGYQM